MSYFRGYLLLLVTFAALTSLKAEPVKPVFKSSYHATGLIRLPYAELEEPFEIFYQGAKNRSRIDVYNGVDKTLYRGDEPQYGNMYKISPTTLDDKAPTETCFNFTGDKSRSVQAQSLLPDITNFKFYMSDVRKGQMVDLWQNVTMESFLNQTRKNVYTFAVTQTSPPRPVQYEMMGFDTLLGSHYDKYVIDYDFYDESSSAIPNGTFNIPDNLTCNHLIGVGSAEREIEANPFQELVNPERGNRYHALFEEYRQRYSKRYSTKDEHLTRRGYFIKNVRLIHSINRAKLGFVAAINHLADHAPEELGMMRGRRRSSRGSNHGLPFEGPWVKPLDLPKSIDWNIRGAVSPVKDQAICGSCWSFGAAETIEGAYFNLYNQRARLSPQMLMDCTWAYGNYGCDGGEESQAYDWLIKHGVLLESDKTYGPYLGQNGKCHFDKKKGLANVTRYHNVTSGNQTELKIVLYLKGPVAVAIDASQPSFRFYSYGLYYDPKCGNTTQDLDHTVLAVGYGTYQGQDYWLVKNSWSTYWGNNGYVMISMKGNNCGVATAATYVRLHQ